MYSNSYAPVRLLLALAAMILSAVVARAEVVNVSASPEPLRINTGGAAMVTVRWEVDVYVATPQRVTVTSPAGVIIGFSNGETPGGPLSRSFNHPGGLTTITFNDRVRFSRTLAMAIANGSAAEYQRSFFHNNSDTNNTDQVDIEARTSGGSLAIRDVSLQFDDDTLFRTVPQNARLTARAILSTSGENRLIGSWEVSGPDGGAFRTIARVRQVLAGSRRTVFESPALPTRRTGNYLVRFVPQQGYTGNAEIASIRYIVRPGGAGATLSLISPRAGESPSTGTPFRWSAVPGAVGYRLEFREGGAGGVGNGARVAAVDLRTTETRIKPFTLARVRDRTPVFWRVVAFDGDGNTLATSPARQLGGGTASQGNN